MSSIYKKGRDGYYYYQAYIYNPLTNKKDKRIFHALRTRDKSEAEEKKYNYDLKYKKSNKTKNYFSKVSLKKTFSLLAIFVLFAYFFLKFSTQKINKPRMTSEIKSHALLEKINTLNKINFKDEIVHDTIGHVITGDLDLTENIDNSKNDTSLVYKIERIEKLSGTFNQVQLFVTVDKNMSDHTQLLICENLMEKFNEFSNIVICIYSSDANGKSLALGNNNEVSLKEKNKSWLAMFTHNLVEGAYFDNSPSSYFGLNK